MKPYYRGSLAAAVCVPVAAAACSGEARHFETIVEREVPANMAGAEGNSEPVSSSGAGGQGSEGTVSSESDTGESVGDTSGGTGSDSGDIGSEPAAQEEGVEPADADLQGDEGPTGDSDESLPALSTNSDQADLGRTEVGTQGASFNWEIANTGDVSTGVLTLTGVSSDFVVDNSCTASLGPGASCAIAIQFVPQSGGELNTTMELSDGEISTSLIVVAQGLVRVDLRANGTGAVASDSMSCQQNECTGVFEVGEELTVRATTQNGSGSYFSGWSGATCDGPVHTCTFAVVQGGEVTANFSPMENNLIFVSSESFPTDLGGVLPYDAECNRLASEAGINNAAGDGYVAWMADNDLGAPRERVPPGVQGWRRLDGKPFASTVDELFDEDVVYNAILFHENGDFVLTEEFVMTGLNNGGVTGNNCLNWSVAQGNAHRFGRQVAGPGAWYSGAQSGCSETGMQIYCAGITQTSQLVPERSEGKLIWITRTPFVPGTTDPDALCFVDRPVGVASSAALIARTTQPAVDVLNVDAIYVRPDGQRVGTGATLASHRNIGTGVESGIWQYGDGEYEGGNAAFAGVFTGAANPVELGTPEETCSDWTDPNGTRVFGILNVVNGQWWVRNSGAACTPTGLARIYCIEQ